MILHCPLCHGTFSLDALIQDQAGRELLMLMAQQGPLGPPLLQYLTLFRSEKRALPFDRSLRLAQDVLALPAPPEQLAVALAETVESLRARREQGGPVKPLRNHNYLKRVLESQPAPLPGSSEVPGPRPPAPGSASSKTARAIGRLDSWKKR